MIFERKILLIFCLNFKFIHSLSTR